MSGLFKSPKPPPLPPPPVPVLQADDAAMRRARLRAREKIMSQSSGRLADHMGASATQPYVKATTRSGAGRNAILSGAPSRMIAMAAQ